MVTGRRDGLAEWPAPIVAHQRAGFAPGLAVVQAIERMTRGDAGLATAALVEIDLEGVLLAGRGRGGGHQLFVVWLADFVAVVRAGKFFHGGEVALFGQQRVDQRERFRRLSSSRCIGCGSKHSLDFNQLQVPRPRGPTCCGARDHAAQSTRRSNSFAPRPARPAPPQRARPAPQTRWRKRRWIV